jgi:hypothetical protein
MGPSEKAFHQVRNILGKLDRNIDSLRAQRTNPAPAPSPQPAPPAAAERTIAGSSTSTQQPPNNRPPSAYGRATPIVPKN